MRGSKHVEAPILEAPEHVKDEEAYPEITAGVKNIRIAQALSFNLAGAHGEDAAVHGYLYQHWRFADKQEAFAQCMKRIAVVEMHHLDIFGQLIRQLGGDPCWSYYAAGRRVPFHTGCLAYPHRLARAVAANLAAEKRTYAIYQKQAEAFRPEAPCISKILERIALDEKLHIEIFQQWFTQLRGGIE